MKFKNPSTPIVKTALRLESFHRVDTGETLDPASLRGQTAAAFCGIGRPDDFIKTLEDAGTKVVAQKFFPDHHRFSAEDLESLENQARASEARFLMTTEKDAVKLKNFALTLPLLTARVKIVILEGEEIFDRLIGQPTE